MKYHARPTVHNLRDMDPWSYCTSNQSYDKTLISKYVGQYTDGHNPLYVCGNSKFARLSFSIELARNICRMFPYIKSIPDYRRVHIIPYLGSIQKSISELYIPGYILLPWADNWGATQEDHEYQRYCEKLQLLHDYSLNPGIFILDGVDGVTLEEVERDPAFSDLLKLGVMILVSDDLVSKPNDVIEFKAAEDLSSPRKCDFTREELVVLQNASLLPPDGMITRMFVNAIGRSFIPTVRQLIDTGKLSGDFRGRVFPPIERVIGTDDDYLPFLRNIYRAPNKPRSYYPAVWNRSCYILDRAVELLPDTTGQFAYWAAELHKLRGDHTNAVRMIGLFLKKQQALENPIPFMLSTAYFEAANCEVFLGDIARNKEFNNIHFQNAYKLLDSAIASQSSGEHLNLDLLSDIILTKAWLLKDKGDIRTAEQLVKEVLRRQEDVLGLDDRSLAQWYIKAASLYNEPCVDLLPRQKYVKKALELLLVPDSKNDRLLADACILMESCINQSDIKGRISWERRALSSLKSNSPWCRHLIYRCHLHLAYLAECNNDSGMQINELCAAIAILLEMLPANHPRIRMHAHSIVELSKKSSNTNNNFSS